MNSKLNIETKQQVLNVGPDQSFCSDNLEESRIIDMNRVRKNPTHLRARIMHSFKNEQGVIDLASIMVGIVVIGMIGSVIAATVFAVIPWSQDAAAKHQLDSIVAAENAHIGFSSATPSLLPAGSRANSYGDSVDLEAANLLKQGKTYCVIESADGKDYTAYSQSASSKVFFLTSANTKPQVFGGTLPPECAFIATGVSSGGAGSGGGGGSGGATTPYVDPTPKFTTWTFKCDTTKSGAIPLQNSLVGTETWSDGVTKTYNGSNLPTNRTLQANIEYKVTFNGTYKYLISSYLSVCLISLDHLGNDTGVVYAGNAFYGAENLQSVPEHVPATLTDMSDMFNGVPSFSHPNVSKWDVSNVTNMDNMFAGAAAFNEPLNNWNVSKVTSMNNMFADTFMFSQDLSGWNTSALTSSTNFAPNMFPQEYLPPGVAAN